MSDEIKCKLIILKNQTNQQPIILYCSAKGLLDSPFLEDLSFEDGKIEIEDTGLWVWEGTIRIEPAGWFGPSWNEGGLYIHKHFASGEPDYDTTLRRPTAYEMHALKVDTLT